MVAQKATILCVYEVLKNYSDENHIMSADKICERLKTIYDVSMERRAVYRNIEALRSMGIEIEGYRDNREGYYLIDRDFELSEIRLLCDAVAASDMIKAEDSKAIIKKLIQTQSVFQGRILQKTLFVKSEKKIQNKQLFYNIDALNIAINQGSKVTVKLMEYGLEQELCERADSPVTISPYVTMWTEGHYYLIAKRENEDGLEHFRIDFMKDIQILERGVDMVFGGINPEQYAKRMILQRGEMPERFDILCKKELWQELAETFGKEADIIRQQKEDITVRVSTIRSKMKQWVLEHINQCGVISPKKFKDEIQGVVMEAYQRYWR